MDLPRFAFSFALALSLALGSPVVAQQATDSLAPQTVAPQTAVLDTSASPPAAAVVPQAPPTTRETSPTTRETSPPPSSDVRAELATLRAAVLGLAAQNDSLLRSLAAGPG